MSDGELQPDQDPTLWNGFVAEYEALFEPLTNQFARRAIEALSPQPGERLLDVGAGAGGASLLAAAQGADVTALDAAGAMAQRVAARARGQGVQAIVADARAIPLTDACMASAVSILGVILCPDPIAALREMRRVLKPGGAVAVVTWTRPDRYELVTRLLAAADAVRGPAPPRAGQGPAQLRFADEAAFRALFAAAGLQGVTVDTIEAALEAPSARSLGGRLGFAPGLAATLASFGPARPAIVDRFVADLERDQGQGRVSLDAVASLGIGRA